MQRKFGTALIVATAFLPLAPAAASEFRDGYEAGVQACLSQTESRCAGTITQAEDQQLLRPILIDPNFGAGGGSAFQMPMDPNLQLAPIGGWRNLSTGQGFGIGN